jgi:hypothetical protein
MLQAQEVEQPKVTAIQTMDRMVGRMMDQTMDRTMARQYERLIGCAINQPTVGHYTQLIWPIRLPYLLQSPPIQTTIHKPGTVQTGPNGK